MSGATVDYAKKAACISIINEKQANRLGIVKRIRPTLPRIREQSERPENEDTIRIAWISSNSFANSTYRLRGKKLLTLP
jgi:hypothetical protein